MPARHDGTAWPPLARLKTAAGVGLVLLVIFVCFVEPDGTERPCDTATVNGNVWRREPAEVEDAFLKRVAVETSPASAGLYGFGATGVTGAAAERPVGSDRLPRL